MNAKNLIKLIFWIAFFESVGFLLGLLTQANIYPWYSNLNKSFLTPPGFIFSIVWSLLYGLFAVIAWILSSYKLAARKISVLFTLQILMNWAWTPLFFGMHLVTISAIWLIALIFLNVILIIEAKKINTTIAWLLTPYVLWLLFASYLNVFIAINN